MLPYLPEYKMRIISLFVIRKMGLLL